MDGGFLLALVGIGLLLSSCVDPIRNLPLSSLNQSAGYRFANLRRDPRSDTLVIVTASGGGLRAAALELSVLEGMNDIKLASGGTLADHIDILSAVSGGSVTAAYFALHHSAGFADLERDFLRRDGIGAILRAGLNPVGLARISTTSVERIDLLIDYLDGTLFTKHETYQDLVAAGSGPFLILNAADMVEGVPFAFTQSNFDLLCSDLSPMKLSTAVAASAAFPAALSPLTLRDYSQCAAQSNTEWPPIWAQNDAATNWRVNRERAELGRAEMDYALGDDPKSLTPKKFIHLLDGGVAENLGVTEPIRILTTNSPAPGVLDAMENGRIKRIVFVMINARSFATSRLDLESGTPGIIDMLLGAMGSAIDQAAAGARRRLEDVLTVDFARNAARLEAEQHPDQAANVRAVLANSQFVEVNFDLIPDQRCKLAFHNIATSWTNSGTDIDALLLMGKALLASSPQYEPMLKAVGGSDGGSHMTTPAACAALLGH